jgi:tetratricopeptide (TPR) repeat protein
MNSKAVLPILPLQFLIALTNCAEINGRLAEAAHLLQQYLEMAPHALDVDLVRARIAELQSLLALPEQHGAEVRRLYALAYGHLAERKYDRALAALNKAKDLTPEFSLTYWKLALIYEAMGNVQLARENFNKYQQLTSDQSAKDEATLHLTTLETKKSKYDEEVDAAEDILADLFNRGMNLTFNLDENRRAIRAHRAQVKKKQDQKKDRNRIGGFSVPYPYAQQELGRASEQLLVALALFPLGAEANELMGLVFFAGERWASGRQEFRCRRQPGITSVFLCRDAWA